MLDYIIANILEEERRAPELVLELPLYEEPSSEYNSTQNPTQQEDERQQRGVLIIEL